MLWKARLGMVILIAAVILLLLIIWYVYKESKGFRVVRYSFVNDKLKTDRFRFAFISDLHDYDHGNDNEDVLKALDENKPDAVFLAGDMVTSSMEVKYHDEVALRFVKAVADKYPLYYGIGNHEEKLRRCPQMFPGEYERYCSALNEVGVSMLIDEKVSIEDAGIDVYGLDLEHEYYRKLVINRIPEDYLKSKFGDPDPDRVSILIAHDPEHFDSYAEWHPDYVLSGHVHGGIVNIPPFGGVISPQLKIFPKYDAGLFEKDGSTMILSRGLGTHTVPIRVNNKAEIVIVDIYKNKIP